MFGRSKRLVVSIIASSALAVVAVPIPASAALGPCVVRGTGIAVEDFREVVAIAGVYRDSSLDGLDIELTCGVVRNGVTVARASDSLLGPVAVVADTATVVVGSYTACYEVRRIYLEHSAMVADTCP